MQVLRSVFVLIVGFLLPVCPSFAAEHPCILAYASLTPAENSGIEADPKAKKIIDKIFRTIGIRDIKALAVKDFKNACAGVGSRNRRFIYYDDAWLENYSNGDRWIKIGVIGHEIGHHFANHHTAERVSNLSKEYQADYFLGRLVAIMGGELADALKAVSKQPIDASDDETYPSRAQREAAIKEGYDAPNADFMIDDGAPLQFGLLYDAATISYTALSRVFTVDIRDYQDDRRITSDDVIVQPRSASVRLGRDNDMLVITAFAKDSSQICAKHLHLPLRDGDNIRVEKVFSNPEGEYYGVSYGREGDLYNVFGIRFSDFQFVFDPRAPRTGRTRVPTSKVEDAVARGASNIAVVDGGCQDVPAR